MEQRKLPFVWELNYKGVISHAVGTHHYLPNIESYVADSCRHLQGKSHLLTETTEDQPWPEEVQKQFLAFTLSLEKLTVPEQEELARAIEAPLSVLRECPAIKFRDLLYKHSGYDRLDPLDGLLHFVAKNQFGMQSYPLETVEEKLAIYKNVDMSLGLLRMLEEERRNPGYLKRQAREEIDLFIQGKLPNDENTPPEYTVINEKRNQIMVTSSLPYLSEPSAIGVGATHFVQKPTMLELWQNEGIKVERIQ